MDLKGKTLFITGASRGIGLAIAKRAARDGEPHPGPKSLSPPTRFVVDHATCAILLV